MKLAKSLVHFLVLLFLVVSCSDDTGTPLRPGTGTGPAEPVPGNGGPYLNYFSNLNLSTGNGILHMLASSTANTDSTLYDIAIAQNQDQTPLPAAAMINRNSIVKSYLGRPLFQQLRSINLALEEMFYIDSGQLYRTDVNVAGRLLQVEISSKTDFSTICDQTNGAFLNLVSAIFFYELPGEDNDCSARTDNQIIRISEDDINTIDPNNITVAVTTGMGMATSPPPFLRNIQLIVTPVGDTVIGGYLVANGTKLYRFDARFSQPQEVTIPASISQPITSLELGSGGIGVASGSNQLVTIDGSLYYYVGATNSLSATVLYNLPSGASIDANVCKKEECLFVENNAGILTLYVIAQPESTSPNFELAKVLMADIQNDSTDTAVISSVQAMVRNATEISFSASNINSPPNANEAFAMYQIDISSLTTPLILNTLPTITLALLETVLVERTKARSIDLFPTSGLVYFNMNYTRLHDLDETTNESQAVVIREETIEGTLDPLTIRKTSAWIGVVDTEVSRQIVIERIILAQTKNKLDADGNELNEPETTLTAYNTANHGISASLGLVAPEVDVVHMSFRIVGNMGLGDAFIAKISPLANLTDPMLLQTDIYYINTVETDSLARITNTPAEEESAFSSCANAGSLHCR